MRFLLAGLAGAWILLLHMLLLAGSAPVERRLVVHLADWPAGAPPVRIALLSDTHPSRPGDSLANLRRTVSQVNAARPDLILLAGDYRYDGWAIERDQGAAAIAPLGRLAALKLAVLGNHDQIDRAAALDGLRLAGARVLTNDAARVGPLAIVGVDDATTGHDDVPLALARAREVGGIPLLFTHNPDVAATLPAGVPLVLAGHTHCGQIALPLIGPIVTQSRYGRRYACGVIREGGRMVIVGAGLGTSIYPLRLGVPPDYWLLTIGR